MVPCAVNEKAVLSLGLLVCFPSTTVGPSASAQQRQVKYSLRGYVDSEPDDVGLLADGADLVINCADRPSVALTSDWVSAACLARRIPHIVGGAYAYHVGSLPLTVLPGRTSCWQCARDDVGGETREMIGGRPGAGPSLAMFSAVTANIAAYDAVRVLIGLPPVTAGRLGEVDFRTLALRWREIPNPCSHVRSA